LILGPSREAVLFSDKQVNKWKSDCKSFGDTSFGIVTLLMASALSPQLTLLPFTSVRLSCKEIVKMKRYENS
jgi:hypothetical protein